MIFLFISFLDEIPLKEILSHQMECQVLRCLSGAILTAHVPQIRLLVKIYLHLSLFLQNCSHEYNDS